MSAAAVGAIGAACGILIAIAVAVGFHVGRKAWRWAKGVFNTLLRGVRALEAVAQELAYIRNLSGGTIGEQQVGGDPEEARSQNAYVPQNRRSNTVPFPEPILDRFQQEPIPDATLADTDMDLLRQTDADLVDIEKLENMRQSGMEVEDSDVVHPGIVREAP